MGPDGFDIEFENQGIVDALDEALKESEDVEAQYWIRTAAQRLLYEN